MKFRFWGLVLSILWLAACGGGQVKPDVSTAVVQEGLVKLWVSWVKPKGDKYDMNLHLTNVSENKNILIFLSDISCGRGEVKGTVRHTFFNTGERTIQFAPRQEKSFNTVCQMPSQSKGEFTVIVAKIFDNPSGDGKTAGNVIGENLVWRQTDKD